MQSSDCINFIKEQLQIVGLRGNSTLFKFKNLFKSSTFLFLALYFCMVLIKDNSNQLPIRLRLLNQLTTNLFIDQLAINRLIVAALVQALAHIKQQLAHCMQIVSLSVHVQLECVGGRYNRCEYTAVVLKVDSQSKVYNSKSIQI